MVITPKKTIPPIAAAGLALSGCGDDSLQQALDRMERLDPLVTAFCMKNVDCQADYYYYYDVDSCRVLWLYYADTFLQLSDDPAACYDAGLSYFECFIDAECGTAEEVCRDEYAALEAACYYAGYYAGEEVQ